MTWNASAPEAHLYLGQFLIDSGKLDTGADEVRKAIQLDPVSPDAAYELGRALPAGPDAVTALERATRERPSFTAAWIKLAGVELQLGHIANAHKAAEAALRGPVQDAPAHVLMGKVYLAENKPDDAMKEAQAALGIMANSAAAKLLTADAYAQKGEIDLALEQYQAAYGLDHSDPSALLNASAACLKAGRITSAKAFGDKATKDFPALASSWVAYGDALVADKDGPAAKVAYDKALTAKGVDAASVRAKIAAIK